MPQFAPFTAFRQAFLTCLRRRRTSLIARMQRKIIVRNLFDRARLPGTKLSFTRPCISVYIYAEVHTRRQINRTVTTVTFSQRRKCIIMHRETCTRFQSAGANLWRIEIAFGSALNWFSQEQQSQTGAMVNFANQVTLMPMFHVHANVPNFLISIYLLSMYLHMPYFINILYKIVELLESYPKITWN